MVPSCLPSWLFCGRFGLQETNGWLRASSLDLQLNSCTIVTRFCRNGRSCYAEASEARLKPGLIKLKVGWRCFWRSCATDLRMTYSCETAASVRWLLCRWSFCLLLGPETLDERVYAFPSLVLLLSVQGLRVSVGLQSVLVSPAFYVRYKMLLLSIKAGLNLFQKKIIITNLCGDSTIFVHDSFHELRALIYSVCD